MLLIVPRFKLWYGSPSLGVLYIASVLRAEGESVDLLDSHLETDLFATLDRKIENHKSVGITANITHASSGIEIASYIREKYPEKRIIWGGPYSSVEYRKLLPDYADIVVIGEGENQISEIVRGTPLPEIPGIAYIENSKIVINERKGYIQDLDSLPFPAWDLVDASKYNFPGHRPQFLFMTQRGCPFNCINCTKFIHGRNYRVRSVKNTVDEIEFLATEHNCKTIYLWDDNFTLQPERVKKICNEIIDRKLDYIRYAVPAGIRADIINQEMYEIMYKAGFYYLNVAVESADQDVINKLGKELDVSKVPETVNILNKTGFRIGLFFMMGLPFDTKASLQKTVDFAASLPAHHAHFFTVTPLPGTELFEMANQNGKLLKRYEEESITYDNTDDRIINDELTSKEVEKYIKKAYRRFYTPGRIMKIMYKMTCDGSLKTDLPFFLSNGYNILTKGHR